MPEPLFRFLHHPTRKGIRPNDIDRKLFCMEMCFELRCSPLQLLLRFRRLRISPSSASPPFPSLLKLLLSPPSPPPSISVSYLFGQQLQFPRNLFGHFGFLLVILLIALFGLLSGSLALLSWSGFFSLENSKIKYIRELKYCHNFRAPLNTIRHFKKKMHKCSRLFLVAGT